MGRRILLLLLLPAMLALGLLCYLRSGDDGPLLAVERPDAGGAAAIEAAGAAAGTGPALPQADGGGAARVEAAAADEGRPEIPADAKWVAIRVVDAVTQEPLAGAAVDWMNEATNTRADAAFERLGLAQDERNWRHRDLDRIAREFGWHTVSDRDGLARVHLQQWTTVVARAGSRYGLLGISEDGAPPPGGYRLELAVDRGLLVAVRDADDRPACGVPIGVAIRDAAGKVVRRWNWGPIARTEAPDGIARILHLQMKGRSPFGDVSGTGTGKTVEHRVYVLLPGIDDPGVAFDPEAPPAAPVPLRLPPCGRVAARPESRGWPVPREAGWSTVSLVRGTETRDSWNNEKAWWRSVDADGWVHFPYVPVGGSYTARMNIGTVTITQPFAGPAAPGQEVAVVLRLEDDQIVLRGRVLDDHRQPAANARQLVVAFEAGKLRGENMLQTDGDGRFTFCLGKSVDGKPDSLQRFEVTWQRQDAPVLRGRTSANGLRPGSLDLGDVVLEPLPLVVAGRLVAGDQPFKKEIAINVQQFGSGDGSQPPQWRGIPDLQTRAKDGRFEVRGIVGPGRCRLTLPAWNHLPVEPVEFAPGTEDLLVQIRPGSALAATFLLPEGMPWGCAKVALRCDRAPDPTASGNAGDGFDRFTVEPWPQNGTQNGRRRHLAQWSSLPDGTYTLEFRLWPATEPLVSIPDVAVPPPADGDPRLLDIDLRQQIAITRVRLANDAGPLKEAGGVAFLLPQEAGGEWRGLDIMGPVVTIAARPGPLDLLLAVTGYRPQEARGLRDEATVALARWPEQELVLRAPPQLPDGCVIEVSAEPPDPGTDQGRYRTQWRDGKRSSLWRPPAKRLRLEDGRARLPVGDGTHQLRVSLNRSGARHALQATPQTFMPGPAPIEVEVPAATVQQAVERLQQPHK